MAPGVAKRLAQDAGREEMLPTANNKRGRCYGKTSALPGKAAGTWLARTGGWGRRSFLPCVGKEATVVVRTSAQILLKGGRRQSLH